MTFAPGETSKTVLVATVDDTIQESDETFVTNLSNPSSNAVITTSQVTATIHDNDVTKFLVVNDGSTDRTYDYALSGATTGNTALTNADAAPRGMASNAAGTKTWIVDANKNVYVYNSAGTLLGSWTPGGLKSSAVLDGLATNGTDVWLLDSKNATVYRYSGAAIRLSGSQSAASSFYLNSSNSNGKGIVTDSTSLWIVNDGSSNASDKVFKYTLTGSLLGSWTIDAANVHPTGLTIDPNNVSNIWIVDSSALKVFQYNAAASRISGSQGAAATFALAAGNTNPQDIADPPVGLPTPVLATPTAVVNVGNGNKVNVTGLPPSNSDLDARIVELTVSFDLDSDNEAMKTKRWGSSH